MTIAKKKLKRENGISMDLPIRKKEGKTEGLS